MSDSYRIQQGVTLYSFQDEYVWGKLTLEGCLAELQKMGAEGVELLGDQMVDNSPNPEESFYTSWKSWLNKYNLAPVCDDIFINTTLYKNRRLTTRESIAALKAEIAHAHKMGFKIVRMVSQTPNEIIMPCLDFAQEHDVQMALEIHAGSSGIDLPMSIEFIDIMTRANSLYIGLVFDMGLFCRKFPRVITNYFRREGTSEAIISYVEQAYLDHKDMRNLNKEEMLQKYIKNPMDEEFMEYCYHFENNPLEIMKPYLGFVKNIHGKFYEMTGDYVEYSIPYDQIIPFLKTNHYHGFICSEYEGNRFVPSGTPVPGVQQVSMHQNMLKGLIQNQAQGAK